MLVTIWQDHTISWKEEPSAGMKVFKPLFSSMGVFTCPPPRATDYSASLGDCIRLACETSILTFSSLIRSVGGILQPAMATGHVPIYLPEGRDASIP